jgi:arsenate reductase
MQVTVYHNPQCGTSRTVLALLREAGIEPAVIEYLQTPPSRATLRDLLARMGARPRDILRRKGTPYDALGLADPALGDDALLAAIEAHPILIERPIVVAPHGVKLCRPAEKLFELLPALRSSQTAPN